MVPHTFFRESPLACIYRMFKTVLQLVDLTLSGYTSYKSNKKNVYANRFQKIKSTVKVLYLELHFSKYKSLTNHQIQSLKLFSFNVSYTVLLYLLPKKSQESNFHSSLKWTPTSFKFFFPSMCGKITSIKFYKNLRKEN